MASGGQCGIDGGRTCNVDASKSSLVGAAMRRGIENAGYAHLKRLK